ncbi:MAG TPA: hypothetical protein VEG33_14795 [Streptosporangiaceae bacterium]|nr:hypothetical protein [Streptosporangiaceae bacterium]
MSAGWVAGSVRARALARRRIGPAAARRAAASGSLEDALRLLAATPYGREVRAGQTLAQAQHGAAAAILWDLRVLAGWLPPGGVPLLQALAAWFEIANVDELLTALDGRPVAVHGEMFTLGALATAWPRLRSAGSVADLRAALAASAWGDMGADSLSAVRFGMRACWALRVAGFGEPAPAWATAGAALLVAGQRFVAGRPIPAAALPPLRGVLGTAVDAATLAGLAAALPGRARWALAGVTAPGDLWRAEAAWWARVQRDGFSLLRTSASSAAPVLGAAAVLAADAWRVRAALEIAARGGGPLEDYDAVA